MKWTCLSCGKAVEVPNHAAFPDGCPECRGTRWTTEETHRHTEAQVATFAERIGRTR